MVHHALAAITARESRRSPCKTVCYRSGLHHVERNVDVAPCSIGICTFLAVRGVHNGLGDFALQARQADVKPCAKEVNVARIAQVYFGIDGCVSRKLDLHLLATSPIALMKQADQPAANNCSGLVPVPGTPGAENLTSKRPSSLWETPPRRPPEVCVLAVYRSFMSCWVEPATALVV